MKYRKLLPKSPRKAVNILKHLWDQLYKSPRKRIILDEVWAKDKKLPKYMFLAGKYKNKKNVSKLMQTVSRIKNHYKSLHSAWRMTDMHWSQFHRCTSLYKRKQVERKFKRKLNTEEVKSIEDFFETEDASFPLPDKKYSGKRFMKHSLARTCKMYNMLSST